MAAGLVPVVAGALAGWLIPRGPVTTAEALIAVASALLVGFATGWLMRARWAMLVAPATFMLVFELARMRVDGPTVDGIRLDGIYGLLILAAGRGIDAILMLLPMVVGASYGVALVRRLHGPADTLHTRHVVRRGFLALATLAVVALVARRWVLWLVAAAVGAWASPGWAMATLLFGGMLIYPLTVVSLRLAGRPGRSLPATRWLAWRCSWRSPFLSAFSWPWQPLATDRSGSSPRA